MSVYEGLTTASAFANCGDLIRISAESANVDFDPFQGDALIVEAVVRLKTRVTQFF
jgi:hypothetical protein